MPKRKANKNNSKASPSVDRQEMENFAAMAEEWWQEEGKFKPLHDLNQARIGVLKNKICAHFARSPEDDMPLTGLSVLDIGCGGGLLCEPMARFGATVYGIDVLERNIQIARAHSTQSNLDITYAFCALEDFIPEHKFDVILNMEVLEHVLNPTAFIAHAARCLNAGGLMFCATINRTLKAFVLAIFGAEYVMRWLPKGTHQYSKFITPTQMNAMLTRANLAPQPALGMHFNPLTRQWRTNERADVNYIMYATK